MPRAEGLSRRGFVAAGLSLGALPGCDRALSYLANLNDAPIPSRFETPHAPEIDPNLALWSRLSFGAKPGDWERISRMDAAGLIEEQLDPASIDDRACELRASAIDVVHLDEGLLFELPSEQIEAQIARHALVRAVYSKRQLLEVMVELWTDHFHVAIGKSHCQKLLPHYDRHVARAHALGRFEDLLRASALSPAMLVYLDGRENKHQAPGDKPNENYARELLELHTLGVHGGYTQTDVMEAARCLTGFIVHEEWSPGRVEFVPERHDDGEKVVLGQHIPAGGGRSDVDKLLSIVAHHPSTAKHVSRKLVAAFVADEPPDALVESAAQTFSATRGDLAAVLRTILKSEELVSHRAAKIKRPFRFVVSALRALGADTHGKGELCSWLGRMGHAPYAWPTPDGYPAEGEAWLSTLMNRFRFAFALTGGRLDDTRVDLARLQGAASGEDKVAALSSHLLGRRPGSAELELFAQDTPTLLAELIASPDFQRF